MSVLFLDTTVKADIGLIQDNNFITLLRGEDSKSSHKFHYRIYQLLKNNNLDLNQLDAIFQMAGPGSYTGMRLAQGFSGIVELNDIPTYSLYHFEIPQLCGVEEYTFVSNAFKGEYFVYSFKDGKGIKNLIKHSEFDCSNQRIFSNEDMEDLSVENTLVMIEENTSIIKETINKKIKRELYYYRPIDEEFKVKGK